MSVQSNFTSFVASASVTITPPSGNGTASTFPLPAVDGSNTSMTVTNNSTDVAWFALGTVATGMAPGPNQKGSIVLNPGQTVLLTSGVQGTATYCAILPKASGGSLVFTRGTASSVAAFSTHDDATVI